MKRYSILLMALSGLLMVGCAGQQKQTLDQLSRQTKAAQASYATATPDANTKLLGVNGSNVTKNYTVDALKTYVGSNIALNLSAAETNLLWDTGVSYNEHILTARTVDGHVSGALTTAQVNGTMVHNTGMGAADVALDLPAAVPGTYTMYNVVTAQSNKWGVRAPATDTMQVIAADGTLGTATTQGYARMTAAQAGQAFACWSIVANKWQCKAGAIGTSTFAAN